MSKWVEKEFEEFCDKFIVVDSNGWVSKWAVFWLYDETTFGRDRFNNLEFPSRVRYRYGDILYGLRKVGRIRVSTFEGIRWKDESIVPPHYRDPENFNAFELSSKNSDILGSIREFNAFNDYKIPQNMDVFYEDYLVFCKRVGYYNFDSKKHFISRFRDVPRL